jgi:hypothetical protein
VGSDLAPTQTFGHPFIIEISCFYKYYRASYGCPVTSLHRFRKNTVIQHILGNFLSKMARAKYGAAVSCFFIIVTVIALNVEAKTRHYKFLPAPCAPVPLPNSYQLSHPMLTNQITAPLHRRPQYTGRDRSIQFCCCSSFSLSAGSSLLCRAS